MNQRVVITGAGCVTPLGNKLNRVWSRMLDGESGVSEISLFDASALPVRIAAEVDDWQMPDLRLGFARRPRSR